jgi:hypothetical protein
VPGVFVYVESRLTRLRGDRSLAPMQAGTAARGFRRSSAESFVNLSTLPDFSTVN